MNGGQASVVMMGTTRHHDPIALPRSARLMRRGLERATLLIQSYLAERLESGVGATERSAVRGFLRLYHSTKTEGRLTCTPGPNQTVRVYLWTYGLGRHPTAPVLSLPLTGRWSALIRECRPADPPVVPDACNPACMDDESTPRRGFPSSPQPELLSPIRA